jgi:hypothetical protein
LKRAHIKNVAAAVALNIAELIAEARSNITFWVRYTAATIAYARK